jgi:hypothetical protein
MFQNPAVPIGKCTVVRSFKGCADGDVYRAPPVKKASTTTRAVALRQVFDGSLDIARTIRIPESSMPMAERASE